MHHRVEEEREEKNKKEAVLFGTFFALLSMRGYVKFRKKDSQVGEAS